MKKYFLPISAVSVLFIISSIQGAPKLDVGAEYRLRGIQMNNPTYSGEPPIGTGQTFDQKYYSHRARVYLKGKLDPGIEIASVIQAIGVAGSTAPLLNRYPKEDFSPFIENIYLQANEIYDWPVNVTVGRQPYVWGSGLLISDDGMGFDGVRLDAGPLWGVHSHLLTAKAKDKLVGENDRDLNLAGLSYTWGIHNIKFGWIWERDHSGTPYSNLNSPDPVSSDQISRQFYNLQLNGRLERGAFYSGEFAMQRGAARIPGKDIPLSGSVFTFEGGFDFTHPRWKRMILTGIFSQSSGDDPDTLDADEKFSPSFGRKFDGLERVGYGEFFAATPYSFFNEDKVIVINRVGDKIIETFPYTSLYSGMRIFGFRGSVNPWEPFVAGLEFYLYSAREVIQRKAVTTVAGTEKALGRELIITASYVYAKKINVAIRWGKFFPNPLLNEAGSTRLILEFSGRF